MSFSLVGIETSGLCFGYFNRDGVDADEFASAFTFGESNGAVDEGVERMVFAHADVQAGMVNSATLTFDDVTGFSILAAEYFDAGPFLELPTPFLCAIFDNFLKG